MKKLILGIGILFVVNSPLIGMNSQEREETEKRVREKVQIFACAARVAIDQGRDYSEELDELLTDPDLTQEIKRAVLNRTPCSPMERLALADQYGLNEGLIFPLDNYS
jgi:hypothetical protein